MRTKAQIFCYLIYCIILHFSEGDDLWSQESIIYRMTPNNSFPHQVVGGRVKFSLESVGLCLT